MTAEPTLEALIASIQPTDPAAEAAAWARLDQLTKPPRSLGVLEEIAAKLARIQGTDRPDVSGKAIVLAAGDHGVVAQGISPFPQDVTWQMVANFVSGGAAINQIAASVGADLVLVDVGVAKDISEMPVVRHQKVALGTQDFTQGPAMTAEQARAALAVGYCIATELAEHGVRLIATGEMGIGNTTAAAALTAAYTGVEPALVVGRGTGLDEAGVAHKAQVVVRALAQNAVALDDPFETLAALGGLEIACLAGVVLGAAASRTAVVCDGFISGAAALAAVRMAPAAADYLFPSHRSVEPGHAVVLDALGLQPVLELDMRLGEGTGAALAMGIMDASARMLSGMATFADAGVSEA